MFCNFRKTFNPTKEEKEEQDKRFAKLLHNYENKVVNLIKYNNVLFVSEPFVSFQTDCEHCDKYIGHIEHFVEGGNCLKHKCNCGWGFTCNDFYKKEE